jgi:hypothetical protein
MLLSQERSVFAPLCIGGQQYTEITYQRSKVHVPSNIH